MVSRPFIAVDIGNSRTKFALFEKNESAPLSFYRQDHALSDVPDFDNLEQWLEANTLQNHSLQWFLGAVHAGRGQALESWLGNHRPNDDVRMLTWRDIPLRLDIQEPDRVGIDRLLAAYGAFRFFGDNSQRLLVVDIGTAMTIDLIDVTGREGVFRGGAILPGWGAASRALFEQTDRLPLLADHTTTPSFPGRRTEDAISAGLGAMLAGAVCYCLEELGTPRPTVLAAGGGAERLRNDLAKHGIETRTYPGFPELVIAGIAMLACEEAAPSPR